MTRRDISNDIATARSKETSARAAKRQKEEIEAAAVFVMASKGGKSGAEAFLNRIDSTLAHGEARFYGARGEDEIRSEVATEYGVGYAAGPGFGHRFAIRAKTGAGEQVVIPLDFDGAAMIAAAAFAYCADLDELGLANGATFRDEFKALTDDLVHSYMDVNEIRDAAYREQKDVLDVQLRTLSSAAIEKGVEAAERRVADAVRSLVRAAQMPAGVERSMILEEVQPMIRRAFGGDA